MVIVVPSFAEREHPENEVVAAFVITLEIFPAPEMADRVHAPGDVMHQKHAHQSTPDKTQQSAPPAQRDQAADESGDCQANDDPYRKQRVHRTDDAVLTQVPDIPEKSGRIGLEHPPDMCMPEAFDESNEPMPV